MCILCVFIEMGSNGIYSSFVVCFIWPQPPHSWILKNIRFCSSRNMLDNKRNPVLGNKINMLYRVFSALVLANGNFTSHCRFGLFHLKYALRKLRYYYYFYELFCVQISWCQRFVCGEQLNHYPSESYLSGCILYFLQ